MVSTRKLARLLDHAQTAAAKVAGITGVLACRVDLRHRHDQDVIDNLRTHLGQEVFAATVRERIAMREAASARQPITAYAPDNDAAHDYRAVAAELVARSPAAKV